MSKKIEKTKEEMIKEKTSKNDGFIVENVISIWDNGEFTTIELESGSCVHLPINAGHSITILNAEDPIRNYRIDVQIDLYGG